MGGRIISLANLRARINPWACEVIALHQIQSIEFLIIMSNLEIGNLKCFIAVAEEGSFTKAANKINITQSALSQQVSRLEKNLKVQLLNRSKNNTLTDSG